MTLAEMLEQGWNPPLNDYPIFDEEYREGLNNKILNHYLFREIGVETPDKFSFMLHRKMWEIMPYYNQLYESELFDFNPLDTSDIREYTKDSRTQYESGRNRSSDVGKSSRDNASDTGATHKLETIFGEKTVSDTINHETGNEVTHGEYLKQGDKTNDNKASTEQKILEDTTSHSLTTNDLQTDVEGESHSTGTTDTTGSKTTAFSDLPQANLNGEASGDPDDPDRYNWDYLTTLTHENTVEHSETTADQTTESHTTNTGTVEVDGDTHRESTSHTDSAELLKELWHENGTEDGTKDTTDDFTSNVTGTTDQNTNTYTRDTSKTFANEKYHERNDAMGEFDNSQSNRGKNFRRQAGRSGFSPSILLRDYRNILLNVDMEIINQLEPLFMSIY